MTSTSDIFVWVWLPGATSPVPAGVLVEASEGVFSFQYGRRYLERSKAIALAPTLPLDEAVFSPTGSMPLPGALRDATPDAWGRRVILNARAGLRGAAADTADLTERSYMLESGSNRLGAIDFQESATAYVPRIDDAPIDVLLEASDLVEAGEPLPTALHAALLSGTAMGGAQPKALIRDGEVEYIAKFPVSTDHHPAVGAEAASVYLAHIAGLRVPEARVERVLGKSVLLLRRFDRPGGGERTAVVSALTLLKLDEPSARYGTYPQLLEQLRMYGDGASDAGAELFTRIAFNMAITNNDDHLRNHAAFWDGRHLRLTPAYDLSPGLRSGETSFQNLAYSITGAREGNLSMLLNAAPEYGLSQADALTTIERVIDTIHNHWDDAAEFAQLTQVQKSGLRTRQFLNPRALYGLPSSLTGGL